jgi:hypothetical protein
VKLVKTILNRRANQLSIEDTVIIPAWARGRITDVVPTTQDSGRPAIKVTYMSGGPEPILYAPDYVITVERMVPLDQLRAQEQA